jgi:hypothetical protein
MTRGKKTQQTRVNRVRVNRVIVQKLVDGTAKAGRKNPGKHVDKPRGKKLCHLS